MQRVQMVLGYSREVCRKRGDGKVINRTQALCLVRESRFKDVRRAMPRARNQRPEKRENSNGAAGCPEMTFMCYECENFCYARRRARPAKVHPKRVLAGACSYAEVGAAAARTHARTRCWVKTKGMQSKRTRESADATEAAVVPRCGEGSSSEKKRVFKTSEACEQQDARRVRRASYFKKRGTEECVKTKSANLTSLCEVVGRNQRWNRRQASMSSGP